MFLHYLWPLVERLTLLCLRRIISVRSLPGIVAKSSKES